MAVWYCSSTANSAIAQFAISHAYIIGDIIRQLAAPAAGSERVFRCTTAGTTAGSEPTWTLTKGATTTSNTAVFTEVTGNSTYGWSAAAARLTPLVGSSGWAANGDTVYVSSDHAESWSTAQTYNTTSGTSTGTWLLISVSRAGSVPPVAADITPGASIATTGANALTLNMLGWIEGLTFSSGSAANAASLNINGASAAHNTYYKNCSFILNNSNASSFLVVGATAAGSSYFFDNTSITCGSTSQSVQVSQSARLEWFNTAAPILGATLPTTFIAITGTGCVLLRGLDLSVLGAGKSLFSQATNNYSRGDLEDCKLGASVTVAGSFLNRNSAISLMNCDSGATGYRNEWYCQEGTITTETTITRASGATDGVQAVSWKGISNSSCAFCIPLRFAPISQWNILTGSSHTATIEIISSGTLTNDDIVLELEYLGSSATPIGSTVSTALATRLTTAANLTTSSVTWNSSPATPVKQYLQVTFTPQMVGLVIARVKLQKTSATVYVDPVITIA